MEQGPFTKANSCLVSLEKRPAFYAPRELITSNWLHFSPVESSAYAHTLFL
jgi:hypothetical protein